MKETEEGKLLAAYILGNLSEAAETRLEDEYLTDESAREKLLIVEDELVDAYIEDHLTADERKQLESRFLASPQGQRKLELTIALMGLASEPTQESHPIVIQPEPRHFFGRTIRWVAIAATLVCAIVLWNRLKPTGSDSANSRSGRDGEQTSRTSVTPPSRSNLPPVASIILNPVTRNVDKLERLTIPAATVEVKIQLNLETANHKTYKATILNRGEKEVWSGQGLQSRVFKGGAAIDLDVPAASLNGGEYTLLLRPDKNGAHPIAEYAFTVEKGQPPQQP